jgi:site-specific DNA-methyltransferase (cytosine-N4-specific)
VTSEWLNRVHFGDCRKVLPALADVGAKVRCIVTSPPYWGGVRDYGRAEQLGLERDPADYVQALVQVFALARNVLADDGSLWLNVGDVFAASGKGGGGNAGDRSSWATVKERKGFRMPPAGYKMKDLTLVPFALADALRRDGWYLRQTIVWRKPAAVEPLRLDRPASSHEYVFLLTKAEHYAVRNPGHKWWGHSVWDIRTDSDGSHPAAMPSELAERCIVCATEPGDVVLDPFVGSGTTARVAQALGRQWVGIELNDDYTGLQVASVSQSSLPLEAA